MYQHSGITYLSEEEYRLAEPDLLRQAREKKKRRKIALLIAAVAAVYLLLLGYTCAELLREARWHAHPHEHNESAAFSDTLPTSES